MLAHIASCQAGRNDFISSIYNSNENILMVKYTAKRDKSVSTKLSLVERSSVRNVVFSSWREHLRADERDLVSYILECTVAWGRDFLELTFEQMSNGIPAREGTGYKWLVPPIGISRSSFYRVVDSLKKRGVLFVEAFHRTFTRIWINLEWNPEALFMSPKQAAFRWRTANLAGREKNTFHHGISEVSAGDAHAPSALASQIGAQRPVLPVRTARPPRQAPLESQTGTSRVPDWDSLEKDVNKKDETVTASRGEAAAGGLPVPKRMARTPQSLPPPRQEENLLPVPPAQCRQVAVASPAKTVERVLAESWDRTAQQAARSKELDTPGAYEYTFAQAWAEAYPGVPIPGWTDRDKLFVRSTLKARFRDNVPLRHAFIEYVVRNWKHVIADQFRWMTQRQPPSLPAMDFVCNSKFIGGFLDAFADKERVENIRLLPAEERELAEMMDGGMRREDALVKIGERRQKSKHEAGERKVRQLNREALQEAGKARAEREAAARAEMRRRAEEAKRQREQAMQPSDPFEELERLPPLEPFQLPPFDPSVWN